MFDAWTDPKHIAHWWGPPGFTNTIYRMDVRPGGVWRFIMHGPDGTDYKNKIEYIEVVRPERLVYLHGDDVENDPGQFHVIVSFAEEGGKTRLTMRMLLASAAELEKVKQFGAVEGGKQTLERFAGHLARMRADGGASDGDLVMTRVFQAPPAVVFQAWIDPERMKRWWGPEGFTNPVCELDPRPGGAIRIHMRAPDGTVYPMTGVYHEVVEPERIVFTSAALDERARRFLKSSIPSRLPSSRAKRN